MCRIFQCAGANATQRGLAKYEPTGCSHLPKWKGVLSKAIGQELIIWATSVAPPTITKSHNIMELSFQRR